MPRRKADFRKKDIEHLRKRAGERCSICRRITAGPSSNNQDSISIGIAAHICAAQQGGPRYDPDMTDMDRKSIMNAIWVCHTCSDIIDKDKSTFTKEELHNRKKEHVERIQKYLFSTEMDLITPKMITEFLNVLQPYERFREAVSEISTFKMVGREKNKSVFRNFLLSKEKCIFIYGASGIGKTRFVLETLDHSFLEKVDASRKWVVFRLRYERSLGLNEKIEKLLHWLSTVYHQKQVILLLDDLQEYDSLTVKQLIEKASEKTNEKLKLVFTGWESIETHIEKMFQNGYYRGISSKFKRIYLEKLSVDEQKELLDEVGVENKQSDDIINITHGYPDILIWAIKQVNKGNISLVELELDKILKSRFNYLWSNVRNEKDRETLRVLALLRSIDVLDDNEVLNEQLENSLENLASTELVVKHNSLYTFKRPQIADFILKHELLDSPIKLRRVKKYLHKYLKIKPVDIAISIIKLQEDKELRENIEIIVDIFFEEIKKQVIHKKKPVVDFLKSMISSEKQKLDSRDKRQYQMYFLAILHISNNFPYLARYRTKITFLIKQIALKHSTDNYSVFSSYFILSGFGEIDIGLRVLNSVKNSLTNDSERNFFLTILGTAGLNKGDLKKGYELLQRVLNSYRKKENIIGMAYSLDCMGIIRFKQGFFDEALTLLEQSLELHKEIDSKSGMAANLSNMGGVKRLQGDLKKAEEHYKSALEIDRGLNIIREEAAVLSNLGDVYIQMNKFSEAFEMKRNALKIFEKIGSMEGIATALSGIAWGKMIQGKLIDARRICQKALKINREMGNKYGEASTLIILASIYRDLGDFDEAKRIFQRNLKFVRKIGDKYSESAILREIGDIKLEEEKLDEAYNYFNKVLVIQIEIGDKRGEIASLESMTEIKIRLKKLEDAYELYEKIILIEEQIGKPRNIKTLIQMGKIQHNLRNLSKATKIYEEIVELVSMNESEIQDPFILEGLAEVYHRLGNLDKANHLYNTLIAIYNNNNDKTGLAIAIGNLGHLMLDLENFKSAYELCNRSLVLHQEHGDKNGEASVLGILARIQFKLGDIEGTEKLYKRAIEVTKEIGNELGTAIYIGKFATMKFLLKDYTEAVRLYNKELEIYHRTRNIRGEIATLTNIGITKLFQDRIKDAENSFKKALKVNRSLNDKQEELYLLKEIVKIKFRQERMSDAEKIINKVLKIYREKVNEIDEVDTLFYLGSLKYSQKKYLEAFGFLTDAMKIASRNDNQKGVITCQQELVRLYENEQVENKLRLLAKQYHSDETIQEHYIRLLTYICYQKGNQQEWDEMEENLMILKTVALNFIKNQEILLLYASSVIQALNAYKKYEIFTKVKEKLEELITLQEKHQSNQKLNDLVQNVLMMKLF